jgi:hypothetical protein
MVRDLPDFDFAGAADAAEGAEARNLPIQPHRPQRGRTYDGVASLAIPDKLLALADEVIE